MNPEKVPSNQEEQRRSCGMKNSNKVEPVVEQLTEQFQNLASPSKFGSDKVNSVCSSDSGSEMRNPELESRRNLKRPGRSSDLMQNGKPPKVSKTYELRSRTNLLKKRKEPSIIVDGIDSKKRKVVKKDDEKNLKNSKASRRKSRVKSNLLDSNDSKRNNSGVELKSINDIPNLYLPFLESSDDEEENAETKRKVDQVVFGCVANDDEEMVNKSDCRDDKGRTVKSYSRLIRDSPSPPPSPDRFKIRKFMRPRRQSLSSGSGKKFKYNMPWLHRRTKSNDKGPQNVMGAEVGSVNHENVQKNCVNGGSIGENDTCDALASKSPASTTEDTSSVPESGHR